MIQTTQPTLICVIIIAVLASIPGLEANKLSSREQDFLRRHTLANGPIKETLDTIFARETNPVIAFKLAGCTFIKEVSRAIVTHPKIPSVILKSVNYENQRAVDSFANLISSNRNINRIVVNESIRECIKKYNLQHIITPQKHLYHIPGTPHTLCDSNYIVVAQRLDLLCESCNKHRFIYHLTSDQEREILTVIKYCGYGDAQLRNICFTKSNKIVFIDTEQIYSADILETIGFKKILHVFAGSQGVKKFKDELQKLRPGLKKPMRSPLLCDGEHHVIDGECRCRD